MQGEFNNMSEVNTIPYTYLVGWTELNLWYYGCRYADGCSPSDLWVKYFTSSKLVKNIRKMHGEPDVINVRKTFDDKLSTREWEIKVIHRMGIVRDKRFLNQRNPGGLEDFMAKKGTIPWNKGKTGVWKSPYKGITGRYTKEHMKVISEKTKEAMDKINPEFKKEYYKNRDSCNNRIWINKEGKLKRIKPEFLNEYLDDNWSAGKLQLRDISGKFITKEKYSKETTNGN
jgi:hypothetical protein